MLRQNLIKSMANCQNLLNDVKSRDNVIKSLKTEIDNLKKNFEESKKKLNRSEREVTTLKKRETQFLENIKEFSEKESEQQKQTNDLNSKYNKLVQQYDNQQSELHKIHDKSEMHLLNLQQKEKELQIALQEVEKAKENIKIEEEKQLEMKKRLKEYERQLKSIPTEIKEEVENNNVKWEQKLQEQKSIYEEQYENLKSEIEKKTKQEEELLKRNKELLLQIDTLSNQINDMKAERELDMSLSSLNGSTGMIKTLNVELNNALAADYEKDNKIKESIEEIADLQEKCEILEKEIEIIKKEKQELIEKEKEWKNEKEENVILITEYLEPNLKKYMDNEVILKNTIEELNKEVADLKQNMEKKVQDLFQQSKADLFKEYINNNKLSNIDSIENMVNNAVQTSDDMKDIIDQLGKGIDDIDKMNNDISNDKLQQPLEYNASLDHSDLIIADENTIDSEVPVISCNISLIDEDMAKINGNNDKLYTIQEEIIESTKDGIIIDNSILNKSDNQSNENDKNNIENDDSPLNNENKIDQEDDSNIPLLESKNTEDNKVSSNYNSIMDRKRKNNIKTVATFLFFQLFVIIATALSVVLMIEKMLGIRIIMKFVDNFLEDKNYISTEGSPS